jgi:hypothetical protein
MDRQTMIEQIREWADALDDDSSDLLKRTLPGVIAGMREVAEDLVREAHPHEPTPRPWRLEPTAHDHGETSCLTGGD